MRRSFFAAAVLLLAAVVLGWWWRRTAAPAPSEPPRAIGAPVAPRAPAPPKLAALANSLPPESISPIADGLGAPGGDIRHDLEILNAVFVAWQTNFPRDGNPVGENDEITAALAGDNRLHFAFVSPKHPAINARGELCDRWGTPFRFHQLSGTQMEIRSAGPDRKFGTADDVEFAPWPKQP